MNLIDFVTHGMGLEDLVTAVKALVADVQELKRDVDTLKAIYTAVQSVLHERQDADRLREGTS